jgi:integrating conjugative element protein (TIGR03757 family)
MKCLKKMAILACALSGASNVAWADNITIYTTTFLPPIQLEGESAHTIWLDLPDQMLKDLSRHSPTVKNQTAQDILNTIREKEGAGFFQKLNTQVTGLVSAWSHGIEALPAIVFEDRYVLYGMYSLSTARARVDAYRAGEPQ